MAELAASAFLSAVLGTVSNEAGNLIHGELKLLCGAKDELESLTNTFTLIQDFLDDAESRQYKENSVKTWLRNLKDIAYDAQDVINEAATEALRRRAAAAQTSRTMRVSRRFISYASCSTPVPILFNYRLARKIKAVRERLDRIHKDVAGLGLQQLIRQPGELLDRRPPRETSSAVPATSVFGRTEDLDNLVQLLLSSDSADAHGSHSGDAGFSVISIVGMGGLGKTTLAQLAYNDGRTQQHFDARAWVHVSPKFDVVRLIREILESITMERPNLTTLDTLQTQLRLKVRGKRFLIVLDDVWNLEQGWEQLCAPFHQAKVGSKVLITTRIQSCADTVASTKSINLSVLASEECWSILQGYAFGDERPQDHPRLEMLGRRIAEKAKGVPLAAKALGGILKPYGLDEGRWRNVLETDVSQLREDEDGIMPVLRLSYQHLHPHLKQCFAYCAVFPKGANISRERLVWRWMALGFIQTQGNERMEDVGNDYFHALLGRSFFFKSKKGFPIDDDDDDDDDEDGDLYSMHDLMHDLSQAVSEGECAVMEDGDNLEKVPQDVRHLTLCTLNRKLIKYLPKFRKMRSLLFFCNFNLACTQDLEEVFKKLSLRVLDLEFDAIDEENPVSLEIPSSISSLKHLRYLRISFDNIDIDELPESLGTLYNLQTLVALSDSDIRLPKGMSNLVQLRHFKANANRVSNIDGIGKLTSLQELEKFSVGKGKGHKVEELSNLNQIRGSLCISNLENVVSREEAMEAKLDNKTYIDTLELEWSKNRDASPLISIHDELVLEGLKPHSNLKGLIMNNYRGVRSSGWMQNQLPPYLETFRLFGCTKLEIIPPLGHLPSLEDLVLIDIPRWEEFSGVEEGQLFRRLHTLVIRNCPKLRGLPPLPLSLTKLVLDGVGLRILPEIWGCPLYSSLLTLEISNCPNLRSLHEGLLQQDLGALVILRISDWICQSTVCLPGFKYYASRDARS